MFSFKLRGAYNKMAQLTPAQLKRGVIAASAGNHAQGVALSAQKLGCKAIIVMPATTPQIKIQAVASRGAKVVLHGDSYSDAYQHALELEKEDKLTFVHPYDDPDVIAGQGTIAMEILRQHTQPIHAIFVAIGGGGLIAGVAAYVKQLRPEIRVIGVQPVDSDAMYRSVKAKRRVTLEHVGLFADGVAVKQVGRGDLPPVPQTGGRNHAGGHRCHLRRDQGRVRGYALDPRAGGCAGHRRRQAVCRAQKSSRARRWSPSPPAPT